MYLCLTNFLSFRQHLKRTMPQTCVVLRPLGWGLSTLDNYTQPLWKSRSFFFPLNKFISLSAIFSFFSLSPGQRISYQFGDDKYGWSKLYNFTVPPQIGPKTNTRIIAYGGTVIINIIVIIAIAYGGTVLIVVIAISYGGTAIIVIIDFGKKKALKILI